MYSVVWLSVIVTEACMPNASASGRFPMVTVFQSLELWSVPTRHQRELSFLYLVVQNVDTLDAEHLSNVEFVQLLTDGERCLVSSIHWYVCRVVLQCDTHGEVYSFAQQPCRILVMAGAALALPDIIFSNLTYCSD